MKYFFCSLWHSKTIGPFSLLARCQGRRTKCVYRYRIPGYFHTLFPTRSSWALLVLCIFYVKKRAFRKLQVLRFFTCTPFIITTKVASFFPGWSIKTLCWLEKICHLLFFISFSICSNNHCSTPMSDKDCEIMKDQIRLIYIS